MVRRNYRQCNRFKNKVVCLFFYFMKVLRDLDMLLIWIKIGNVQKFVEQRDFLDALLLICLKFFIQLCSILKRISIPANTREQPVCFSVRYDIGLFGCLEAKFWNIAQSFVERIKFIGSSRGTNSKEFASLQLAKDYKWVYLSAADTEDKWQRETLIMNVLLSVVIQESFSRLHGL